MSKTISKARKLIRIIQYGESSKILSDLAYVGHVSEQLLILHTVHDVQKIKRQLFRRLVSIAENIN